MKLVPVGFCEDTALTLAERTFRSEVDEKLAEDVIQYARRLHGIYTAPTAEQQPSSECPGSGCMDQGCPAHYANDYRDSVMFGEFCEYVTLNLLRGNDCEGIDAELFMGDLLEAGGSYRLVYERVAERLTEEQFKAWLND